FNDTRITGNDPLVSNLTAILAYYAYIIIGLDYDSFSPRGGMTYFKKAQNIVNNAPEDSKNISGWKPFEGTRNRYWLADDLLNTRFSQFHEVMYQYYRLGLDQMYGNMNAGRGAIMDCLNILSVIHEENPNSMLLQLFFLARSTELIGIFSQAPFQDKQRAQQLLTQLDVPNASKYEDQLK
ncbi:MAG: type IX secretion system protein PorD, partial [Chitinophagaceae bacterium]